MHELSIAMGIVNIAEQEVHKARADRVAEINLLIGTLSGIELDALEFAWPVAVKGTVLEQAKRHIELVEGRAKCLECEQIFDVHAFYDSCPKCNSYFKEIFQGKELRVQRLILEKENASVTL